MIRSERFCKGVEKTIKNQEDSAFNEWQEKLNLGLFLHRGAVGRYVLLRHVPVLHNLSKSNFNVRWVEKCSFRILEFAEFFI